MILKEDRLLNPVGGRKCELERKAPGSIARESSEEERMILPGERKGLVKGRFHMKSYERR